jgi:acyl-CoA reductase-like NAD-dependent aldehyde dehydrogenase
MEIDKVVHFANGEVLAEVSRANGGLVERDMRHAQRARDALREIPIKELLKMVKKAADLYTKAELPLGSRSRSAWYSSRARRSRGLPTA